MPGDLRRLCGVYRPLAYLRQEARMTAIMGYCDPWTAQAGDTVRFMVSCIGADAYRAELVRLKQPDAGRDGTPFAPEPVTAALNGTHRGCEQAIHAGSWVLVDRHPAFAGLTSFTLMAYVCPTTPGKGTQGLL